MKMSDLHIEQMERDESPSTIRIEKNVPYPTNERGNTRVLTLDESNMIQSMEIGDSFVVPNQAKVSLYRQYMKRMGKKLESRREHSGERQIAGKFHYRCWYTGDFSSAERLRQVRKKEQQQEQ